MYMFKINAVFSHLGVYIILITAVVTHCYILNVYFSVILTKRNSKKVIQHNLIFHNLIFFFHNIQSDLKTLVPSNRI